MLPEQFVDGGFGAALLGTGLRCTVLTMIQVAKGEAHA